MGLPIVFSTRFLRLNAIRTIGISATVIASMLLTACSKDEDEPIPALNTSFTASAADVIAFTTATLNGKITVGAQETRDCGFVWARTPSPTVGNADAKLFGPKGSSQSLSLEIEDLLPNTKYYVRTVLMLDSGPVYGDETFFTTLRYAEFHTLEATDITFAHVTLNGKPEKHDDENFESGFVWSKDYFPAIETSSKFYLGVQPSDKTVSHTITGLEKSTVYHYRTFILTPSGIIYGNVLNFATLPEVSWQEPNAFPGLQRMGAVSFTVGTNSYIGLGHEPHVS